MAKKIFIIAMILLILAAVMLCAVLIISLVSGGGNRMEMPDIGTEGEYEICIADRVIMDDDTAEESDLSEEDTDGSAESAAPPGTSSVFRSGIYVTV